MLPHRLGRWLIRNYAEFGLAKAPEAFPKSPRHTGKRIGPWVRLPGRHPKRDHYTRVWDDDRRTWLAEGTPGAVVVKLSTNTFALERAGWTAIIVASVVAASATVHCSDTRNPE